MHKYKLLIKNFEKKKYRQMTIKDKNFLNQFNNFRQTCYEYLKLNSFTDDFISSDATYKLLKKLYIQNNQDLVFLFNKKFEVNLKLKKKYDKKLNKKSNSETSICSYMYLGLSLTKLKTINNLQKLNSILKILDKILSKKKHITKCNSKLLAKLINEEKKLIHLIN